LSKLKPAPMPSLTAPFHRRFEGTLVHLRATSDIEALGLLV
jgi:hypothetical protein